MEVNQSKLNAAKVIEESMAANVQEELKQSRAQIQQQQEQDLLALEELNRKQQLKAKKQKVLQGGLNDKDLPVDQDEDMDLPIIDNDRNITGQDMDCQITPPFIQNNNNNAVNTHDDQAHENDRHPSPSPDREIPQTADDFDQLAQLDDLKTTLAFIKAMEQASLGDQYTRRSFDNETLAWLRNAPSEVPLLDDPSLRISIKMILRLSNFSDKAYDEFGMFSQRRSRTYHYCLNIKSNGALEKSLASTPSRMTCV
ncbi:hypothetical protein SERLADRAFT_431907 [Serpula lacrymans var. lacrymans S7.9]|uniref:Uncharacterized protein n=1 Tax=Serpula lacrymans var. lacrymans (strain S7.9) TaxID=578457 RepID=F8NE42_SERL9|nr:uncharacterized protein SERLADRAFT_431907 [Serpula lacrymans var. lacrymans S7.9]EGO30371.1 hypothetical protein SERLADRAFT_431907 [Serpula lacrymans var. lacrymans S7.9]